MNLKNVAKTIVILIVLILFTNISSFASVEIKNVEIANKLSTLGIFNGTDKGFELDREVPRIEGSIMLIRLLGKENLAKNSEYSHPFTDVPTWADNYIGYLYQNGLSKGTSETTFGSKDLMTCEQYMTFILRALGYDDNNGDFEWNKSLSKAVEIGIINKKGKDNLSNKYFIRDDMVAVSYYALSNELKNSNKSLIQKLLIENAISKVDVDKIDFYLNETATISEKTEETIIEQDIDYFLKKEIDGTDKFKSELKKMMVFTLKNLNELKNVDFNNTSKNITRAHSLESSETGLPFLYFETGSYIYSKDYKFELLFPWPPQSDEVSKDVKDYNKKDKEYQQALKVGYYLLEKIFGEERYQIIEYSSTVNEWYSEMPCPRGIANGYHYMVLPSDFGIKVEFGLRKPN